MHTSANKKTNPVRILKTQNGYAILRFGITSIFGVGKEHKKLFKKVARSRPLYAIVINAEVIDKAK